MCYIPFSHLKYFLKPSRNKKTGFILKLAVLCLVWLYHQKWCKDYLSYKLIFPDTDTKVGEKFQ